MKKNNLIQNAHTVILSAHRVILSIAKNLFLIVFAIGLFASCQKDLTTGVTGGKLKDEAQMDAAPVLTLRSPKAADGVVNVILTEGAGFVSEVILAASTRPAEMPQTIVLEVDTTLVAAYRVNSKIEYKVLPEAFYKFDANCIITLDQNATTSTSTLLKIYATNAVGNKLEAGHYLLPVVAKATSQKVSTILYYDVIIRTPFKSDAELYEGEDAFIIFNVNTEYYDPRLVTDFYMAKVSRNNTLKRVWYKAIGNIINLRKATIRSDDKMNPYLDIGVDLKYVLDHDDIYLSDLRESGRSICISIEGSNTGLGFCNLTDVQIEKFSNEIKQLLDFYNLDGVNLFDKNSGYERPDAPAFTKSSYPKLIKNLREKLGVDRLITVTDYEIPTEYFNDVNAMDGIVVGEYIDYAWSGYNILDEGYQIVDPYHQGLSCVSSRHPRNPIVGLSPTKYACVNAPWGTASLSETVATDTEDKLYEWIINGYNQNKICIYEDLRTNLQDKLEGLWNPAELVGFYNCAQTEYLFQADLTRLWVTADKAGYGKWLKNW